MPPLYILIKPASGNCNMQCKYCFYIDEIKNRKVSTNGFMSLETMEKIIDAAFSYTKSSCTFAFQGGEPTLVGIEFYTKLIEMVQYKKPKKITVNYAIQTNGYKLSEEWAKFFVKHNFLVGISLDGNQYLHDKYRVDKNGNGTYHEVMNTIELFKKHGVNYNILTVVTKELAKHINKIYKDYQKNGYQYQQYIECLDPIGDYQGEQVYSLSAKRYGYFLKTLFDAWYQDIMNENYVYNRYFENIIMILKGYTPESCNMCGSCGKQWVIEADGSVYPCDFYVLDEWKLGNVWTHTFEEIDANRERLGFIEWSQYIPAKCKECKWLQVCRNGCRRNCESVESQKRDVNCFCEAYQEFFSYAFSRILEIVSMIRL